MKIIKMDSQNLIVYFDDDTEKTFNSAFDYKQFLRSFGKEKPKKRKKRGKKL